MKNMMRGADESYGAASQVRGMFAGQCACRPIKGRRAGRLARTHLLRRSSVSTDFSNRGGVQPRASACRRRPKCNAPRGWSCLIDDMSPLQTDGADHQAAESRIIGAEPHVRGFWERLGVEKGTKTSAAMFGSVECRSFGGTLWLRLERIV
jgi:hypothetical protein